MKLNHSEYLLSLETQVYRKISSEINENNIKQIATTNLFVTCINENNSSRFQEYYFKTLNNEELFLNEDFFKTFKSKYSLQGIDNNYLERLERNKPQILALIRSNSLIELYMTYFHRVEIKHGHSTKEKSLGSFFAKLVHHFLPEDYCALDRPIKNYFGLENESFILAFLIISGEYKRWATENTKMISQIRNEFETLDKNSKIKHDQITDLKLLDLIFWSKANRN